MGRVKAAKVFMFKLFGGEVLEITCHRVLY
jgi:hypothetical protein